MDLDAFNARQAHQRPVVKIENAFLIVAFVISDSADIFLRAHVAGFVGNLNVGVNQELIIAQTPGFYRFVRKDDGNVRVELGFDVIIAMVESDVGHFVGNRELAALVFAVHQKGIGFNDLGH